MAGCARISRSSLFSRSMTGRGVPAGASTPYHMSTFRLPSFKRAERRHVGQQRVRLVRADRQRLQLAGLDVLQGDVDRQEHHVDLAAQQVGDGGRGAAVADVRQRDPGPVLQQFHRQVVRRAGAGRAVVQRARACALARAIRSCSESIFDAGLATSSSWPQLVRLTGARSVSGLKPSLRVQRRVHHQRVDADQQRAAVGRRTHHFLRADVAGGAGLVVDEERAA